MRKVCELESCGLEFDAKREDARFHSAVCRAKASRARRDAAAPDPAPTEHPDDPARAPRDAQRLNELECRVVDLQAAVEAVAGTGALVRDLAKRANEHEAAIRRAVQAATSPIARDVTALKVDAVRRDELADVMTDVERLAKRLAKKEAAPEPKSDRKLAEIEQAVITLANHVRRLRQDFDTLVAGIAG